MTIMTIAALLFIGWADTLEGIKGASAEITSISAEFTQEKHMKILVKPLVSKGALYYQSPMSLRWEYYHPVQSILLMSNGKIKRYIQRNKTLVQDTGANLQIMQIALQEIARWLDGRFDENPAFTAHLEPGRKIILSPKEKSISRLIQRIELILSDHPGMMKSITIFESNDSFTKLIFNNVVLNQKIPESRFRTIR